MFSAHTSNAPKILIVNSDDFGLTHSINQGIVKCFEDGIVTSASILTNGKAFEEAVMLTRENHLNTGIHLTLTDGQPVSKGQYIPTLIDKNGYFPGSYVDFSLRYFRLKISSKDVETEFHAQIEKFLETGIKPTHVNGHQHVHIFPGILEIVIKLMKEYDIKYIRIPYVPVSSWKRFSFNSFAKLFLVAFSKLAKQKIFKYNLYTTDFFEGLFNSGQLFEDELMKILERIKPGVTELMCHPGFVDKELLSLYPIGYHWEEELKALCSENIKEKINDLGIRLSFFK